MIVVEKVFKELKELGSDAFEPTSVPAIKLHLFNFFKKHPEPSEKELNKEIKKCRRWSKREKEYGQKGNPFPTIGVEIEILKRNLTPDKVAVLDELSIPNYEELASDNRRIWEVNPEFSHGPWIQSRIIQELAMMGALPLEGTDESRHKRVPKERILSLHINLGWPKALTYKVSHCRIIETLSDALNYAFTSPKRIRQLKVFPYGLKGVKNNPASPQLQSASPNLCRRGEGVFFRLELKAPEFRNYPSYRMLAEAQKLSAMLFSYIKKTENLPLSQTEKKLADLWLNFSGEVSERFKEYGIEQGGLNDKPEEAIRILENSDLKQKSREISSFYSRRVGDILKTNK